MIQTLRNEIRELENQIAIKQARIEELLHDEQRINELLEMIRNANLNVEQLEAIVDSINNIENENSIPTVNIPIYSATQTVETSNDVEMVGDVQTADDIEMVGDIQTTDDVEIVENTPTVLVINNDTNEQEEYVITQEMRDSYLTIVGISHQPLYYEEHYTPQIGDIVYLDKETATSNCYGVLEACGETNDFDEDKAIGVLPSENGPKPAELEELGLPCRTHQSMWGSDDLNCVYVITGVTPGKYVTIDKYTDPNTGEQVRLDTRNTNTEDEDESSSSTTNLNDVERLCDEMAGDIEEAKRIFRNAMPDHCVISEVEDLGMDFLISYHNHRANTMEGVNQQVTIPKAMTE